MKTYRIALPVLVACLALGACAGQDGSGNQDGGTTASPSQTGAPVTTPPDGTADPVVPPPAGKPPTERQPTEWPPGGPGASSAPGGATITGTVTSGVEPGCLLLGEYLLVGGPRDMIKSGAKLTVTGRVQPDLMTTCQQGTPFLVDSVRRA
ncbi:hypothetical protein [Micromonospora sagamiensis]|uniref:Lipoprotein n=1 Tax=Micromonospora sagamiensis TaxID=47875 RepID=A0A562WM32_9ACTN|nr:hypothetical protein [Micromonospora sagamiensis]TWJ31275.1 hypothetical protein JD81_04830 [Micromonospora sagamiensis]BCL15680.1 hypothetical protein GCM10017556_34190 [Micromonospora sagamiensis]